MSERCELRSGLKFGLLGAPAVYDAAGEPRPVRSAKGRALLAALLLEPDRVVSLGALKDALWGDCPPASAQASLQNHVTRLRRLLDDPERLRSVPPGYRLRVADAELDVRLFESRVARAREAHAARDWARASAHAADALALWRGTPLSGLPDSVAVHSLVPRLEEARLLALEWRYDAELALGADGHGAGLAALVPELTSLVAEHPFREVFHRHLMLALHRTGRQAEALTVHRELRRRLVEELGVEPGAGVREAHREVLRVELEGAGVGAGVASTGVEAEAETEVGAQVGAALEGEEGRCGGELAGQGQGVGVVSAAAGGGGDGGEVGDGVGGAQSAEFDGVGEERSRKERAPRPAQLPPAPAHFTGRVDAVHALRRGLTGERPFAVVSGMAGVGKSALALHVAHGLREEFPDGQLYVNLRGATPGMTPLTPAAALASLLRDLGAEPRHAPEGDEDPSAASALLRSLLAPTRTLMVLDDAATAAQVRPLLPGGPGCAVVVTSRSPLTALDGAERFPLEPLSDGDSAALLRAVSGRDGLDAGHPLVRLAGRLPLALRIIAARLAARHALTPDALAELLTVNGGRLDHLEYDDLSVRCSLSVALDALRTSDREADRDAALALARIGALDLPTYGVPLLARLLDTDEPRAGAALDRLVDVALLEETAYGRYAPHDLVRDFAREASEDDGAFVDRVVETALRWYAESARRSLLAIIPEGLDRADRLRGVEARLGSASTAEPLSREAAFAWGDTELDNIVALAERHRDTSALVPVLVRCLFPYLQRRGRLTELAALGAVAVAAARRQGDTADEAQALTDLAGMHYMSGRGSEALALNDEALALWRGLGVVSCVRRGLNNRGLLLEGLDRYEESAEALHQSLALAKELADPLSEAVTLSHLGNLYEHTDARAAIAHHERSLAIGETIGHAIVRQSAHCNIGYAHLTLGEPAAALAHLEESLRVHDEYEDWHGASQARLGLVRALRELGRHEDAARECAVLLDRAEQRGDTHMAGLARHQHGLLLAATGRREEAYEQWESALRALDGTDSKVADELRGLLGVS
ncbi:transcriptional regulator, SARP family [Streptomyces formicae]|uniref:Transcriptional regulator, SARP family n=1 Tax=Streptomyces formicae TaxID=1616117 RepID=A0A291QCK5_9ACTN|nr:AfsR/SARP family transcriptional regulator [Streptomyces formicae]ATL29431.1 transcriptional regulator, SARP family [Streptomyces formicae]